MAPTTPVHAGTFVRLGDVAFGVDPLARHIAGINRRAAAAVREAINRRARDYLRNPTALDAIAPGLSHALANDGLRLVEHMIGRASGRPRFVGFGGEVPRINLLAARLVARWARRMERRGVLIPAE